MFDEKRNMRRRRGKRRKEQGKKENEREWAEPKLL